MLIIQKIEHNLIRINAVGKLRLTDYERALPELKSLMAAYSQSHFLIILTDFRGWDWNALLKDFRFDQKHARQFGKTAIVGDNALEKWGTKLSRWLYPSEMRYFESPEPAKAWLEAKSASE